jgi:iron complex transport system substrate-binding protein
MTSRRTLAFVMRPANATRTTERHVVLAALALACAASSVIAAGAAGMAVAVQAVDDTGATIALPSPATRIVSLAPHATELLVAAGARARIVGSVDASAAPPHAQGLPSVGSARALDLERIVALTPDLVVTWPYTVPAQVQLLVARGVRVFVTDPATIGGIATDIERLGVLAGTAVEASRAAAAFRERVARLESAHRPATGEPLRVFYQIWNAPLYTVGGKHLVSEAIRLCGGENVFASLTLPAPGVSVEAVLAARPDVIIAGGDGGIRPSWLDDWKRWPALPAVASGSLYAVNADLLHRPGPRFLEGVEELCAKLDAARHNTRPAGVAGTLPTR